jgi:LacI family transcriptional regulator
VLELADGKPVEPGVRKLPCQLIVRQSCGGNAAVTERRGGLVPADD